MLWERDWSVKESPKKIRREICVELVEDRDLRGEKA